MATILVVDDEPDLREILVRVVESVGHEVVSASDGATAVARARERRPALMILDLMMPGTDGFEVLRSMRDDPELERVPVVVYTALSDPVSRQRAFGLGARGYMVKNDVGIKDLRELVDHYAGAGHGADTGSAA